MKARSVIPLLVAILSAGACRDAITSSQLDPAEPRASTQYYQPPNWRGHWQSSREFWVYDGTPELGLNSHLSNGNLYDYQIGMVPTAGMRLLRTPLYWAVVDPEGDGVYDEGGSSEIYNFRVKLDAALRKNVEIVGVLVGPFNGSSGPYDGVNTEAEFNRRFTRFVRDMVVRYPEVKYWQIWNEMDAGYWAEPWKRTQGGTTDRRLHGRGYARTLRAVYPIFRDASPRRWMLVGGLTGYDWRFTEGMYEELALLGQPFPMDIMAIHGYGPNTSHPEAALVKVHSLTPIMARYNDQNRPIWATETGNGGDQWTSVNGWPSTVEGARAAMDEGQRAYYESLVANLPGSPIVKALGYSIYANDGGPPPHVYDGITYTFPDYTNGLVRSDQTTWRPAYQWLANRASANRLAWDRPAETASVLIPRAPTIPATQPYRYSDDGVIADNVTVNTTVPTPIHMMYPFEFQAHVSNQGWIFPAGNNQVAGTVGQSLDLQAIRAKVGDIPSPAQLCINATVNGQYNSGACGRDFQVGTTGQGLPLTELSAYLVDAPGYSLCYSVHVAYDGWLAEVCNGASAGAAGRRMQAVRFRLYR